MEQIEIALRHFRKADERVHRTEAGAEGEIAGVLFLDVDDRGLSAPGNRRVGRLRPHVHLVEVIQAFQALLADLDAHHVEDFAGRNGQFAADDLVLGLEVAADLDFLDVGFLAFVDLKFQVHRAGVHVGNAVDRAGPGPRKLRYSPCCRKNPGSGRVLGQAVRREGVARCPSAARAVPSLPFGCSVIVDAVQAR